MKKSWTALVEEYVSYRRGFGYALTSEAQILMNFAKFAEKDGHEGPLTTALASQWARSAKIESAITWSDRIQRLRGFAKYCKRYDATTELPPRQLFGTAARRLVPHIFTDEEILALLDAAAALRPKDNMRPITCRAVFGLLVSAGLRVSEAVNLNREDVDLKAGVLTIREAKRHKQRLVPLHATVIAELNAYASVRDRIIKEPLSNRFFIFARETPVDPQKLSHALRFLCRKLGLTPRGQHRNFRVYDFRHTFIVRSFVQFHATGVDVHKAVLSLSTYVGHSEVESTYWYVTGIPELMTLAAERFHTYSKERFNE